MQPAAFSVEQIKELITHFAASGLGSFSLQEGEFALKLESDKAAASHGPLPDKTQKQEKTGEDTGLPDTESCAAPAPVCCAEGTVVTAPVVGTFYRSASPDKAAFVQPGQAVKKGDVLFIIESMKLMNEIQSECDGTVGEILAQDGQGVEYGQPLLTLL